MLARDPDRVERAKHRRVGPELAREDWQAIFAKRYEGEPFVRVLPKGQIATIAHTTHTNYAVLSVHTIADAPNRLLIVSCLDNLINRLYVG